MGKALMAKDFIGNRYGKLIVLDFIPHEKGKRKKAICKCDCGNTKIIDASSIKSGVVRSCGCLAKTNSHTHGLSKTKMYGSMRAMRSRCYYPKDKKYDDYGGRGIRICDEWKNDFQKFYDWSMANGYKDGLTIDRIDNDGNYEPSNCRWTTMLEQSRNKRLRKCNKSGTNGVYYYKPTNKWAASIYVNGKSKHLGFFDKLEDAVYARKEAEKKYWLIE